MLQMNVPLLSRPRARQGPKSLVTWLTRPESQFQFLINPYFKRSCCRAFIAEMVLDDYFVLVSPLQIPCAALSNKLYTPLRWLAHRNYFRRCYLSRWETSKLRSISAKPWLVLWLHRLVNFVNCYTFLNTLLVDWYIYQVRQVPESPSSVTNSNLILRNMRSVLYTVYKRETNLIKCDIAFNRLSFVRDGRWVVPEYS